MPRLAIVSNSSWNIYNFRLGLMKQLIERCYELKTVAPQDDQSKELARYGMDYIPLRKLRRRGRNPFKDLQLRNELRRIYSHYAIDLALQYTIKPNIYGSLATRGRHTKTISTVTGLGYSFLNKGLVNRTVRQLYRRAFNATDKVLFQNRDDMNLFISNGLVNEEKTGLVPGSGMDMKRFKLDAYENSTDAPSFLFLGRLLHDKGVREYMKAAAILARKNKDWSFHILGDIDRGNPAVLDETSLQQSLKNNKSLHYHGTTTDIRPYLKKASALVLPSYREGMPRAVLEAMSIGRPVVATDVPGCRQAVEDGVTGILCEPRSAESLAAAMERMGNMSRDQRAAMGLKGRQRVERYFTQEIVNEVYLGEIRNLLGQ